MEAKKDSAEELQPDTQLQHNQLQHNQLGSQYFYQEQGAGAFEQTEFTNMKLPMGPQLSTQSSVKGIEQSRDIEIEDTPPQYHVADQEDTGGLEDNTKSLQLFGELPDFEMKLFNSSRRPNGSLNEFTYFKRLPIEVRRLIWRACFPKGRTVRLQRGDFFYDERRDRFVSRAKAIYGMSQKDCTPPITAFINQESRIETEKCYGMLMQRVEHGFNYVKMSEEERLFDRLYFNLHPTTKTMQSPLGVSLRVERDIDQVVALQSVDRKSEKYFMESPQRIWYNPETDIAAMDVDSLFYANNSSCYLADLFRNDPRRAVSIRVLSIRNIGGTLDLVKFVRKYGRNVLLFFQGLVELRLTWRYVLADYDSDLADCERAAPHVKAEMEKIIKNMQDRFPSFKAPEISVFYGKRLVLAANLGPATKSS